MATAIMQASGEDLQNLDELVDGICVTLQIKPEQFHQAESQYKGVGDWLSKADSPLARFSPTIYPQGSMALRTTLRPRGHEEFDLDFVVQVGSFLGDPMVLYEMVYDRLHRHPDYKARLERRKRCLRLNYAKDFHLDILPARIDVARGRPYIEVPDRSTPRTWKPSNALGFVAWFERQCESLMKAMAERKQEPLPRPLPEQMSRPLRQAVQLMKRRRDNRFRGDDMAPRSVVLTTLAGEFYQGQESTIDALEQMLAGIEAAINVVHPRPLEVRNPTNDAELFSETWSDSKAYQAFVSFIREFRSEVSALRGVEGIDEVGLRLDEMFGDALGTKAVGQYQERRAQAKAQGRLRATASGVVVGGAVGRRPAPNTFHHGE
jgi:hypothetical protein